MRQRTLRFRPSLRRLVRDQSAIALVEFALAMPIVLGATLAGLELTNFTIAKLRMSQIALQVADNGSRLGKIVNLLYNPQVSETQINDMLTGANMQSGSLGLFAHGRVIVSSLEPDPNNAAKYYIHWQRCKGVKQWTSSYGLQGTVTGTTTTNSMTAMGPTGKQVTAPAGSGVIYVEIAYDYQPLFTSRFAPSLTIKEVAAMTVRDLRDFNGNNGVGVYNTEGATPSACSTFSAS